MPVLKGKRRPLSDNNAAAVAAHARRGESRHPDRLPATHCGILRSLSVQRWRRRTCAAQEGQSGRFGSGLWTNPIVAPPVVAEAVLVVQQLHGIIPAISQGGAVRTSSVCTGLSPPVAREVRQAPAQSSRGEPRFFCGAAPRTWTGVNLQVPDSSTSWVRAGSVKLLSRRRTL